MNFKKRKKQILRNVKLNDIPDGIINNILNKSNESIQIQNIKKDFHFLHSTIPMNYLNKYFFEFHFENNNNFKNFFNPKIKIQENEVLINDLLMKIIFSNDPISKIYTEKDINHYICPFSLKPLIFPGKSIFCLHPQNFDLRQFLLFYNDLEGICPICNKFIHIDDLRFDLSIFKNSFQEIFSDDDEIIIEKNENCLNTNKIWD